MFRFRPSITHFAVLTLLLPALSQAHVSYHLTPLPGVNPGHGSTFACGLNNALTAIRNSSRVFIPGPASLEEFRFRPVRWDTGVLTELPILGSASGFYAARAVPLTPPGSSPAIARIQPPRAASR